MSNVTVAAIAALTADISTALDNSKVTKQDLLDVLKTAQPVLTDVSAYIAKRESRGAPKVALPVGIKSYADSMPVNGDSEVEAVWTAARHSQLIAFGMLSADGTTLTNEETRTKGATAYLFGEDREAFLAKVEEANEAADHPAFIIVDPVHALEGRRATCRANARFSMEDEGVQASLAKADEPVESETESKEENSES